MKLQSARIRTPARRAATLTWTRPPSSRPRACACACAWVSPHLWPAQLLRRGTFNTDVCLCLSAAWYLEGRVQWGRAKPGGAGFLHVFPSTATSQTPFKVSLLLACFDESAIREVTSVCLETVVVQDSGENLPYIRGSSIWVWSITPVFQHPFPAPFLTGPWACLLPGKVLPAPARKNHLNFLLAPYPHQATWPGSKGAALL